MEEWKPIPGFEKKYEVSSLGAVRRLNRIDTYFVKGVKRRAKIKERLLKPSIGSHGYPNVSLVKNKKSRTYLVHRLMAMAFMGVKTNKKFVVDHIDGNKKNNSLENLRIIPNRANAYFAKLSVNSLGMPGVRVSPSGKYRADIRIKGKKVTLGTFTTPEEAQKAYLKASNIENYVK